MFFVEMTVKTALTTFINSDNIITIFKGQHREAEKNKFIAVSAESAPKIYVSFNEIEGPFFYT